MYSLIEQRKYMNEDDVCEWERAHETIDNSKWHGVRAHCSGVRLRHLFWLASFVNQILCTSDNVTSFLRAKIVTLSNCHINQHY